MGSAKPSTLKGGKTLIKIIKEVFTKNGVECTEDYIASALDGLAAKSHLSSPELNAYITKRLKDLASMHYDIIKAKVLNYKINDIPFSEDTDALKQEIADFQDWAPNTPLLNEEGNIRAVKQSTYLPGFLVDFYRDQYLNIIRNNLEDIIGKLEKESTADPSTYASSLTISKADKLDDIFSIINQIHKILGFKVRGNGPESELSQYVSAVAAVPLVVIIVLVILLVIIILGQFIDPVLITMSLLIFGTAYVVHHALICTAV